MAGLAEQISAGTARDAQTSTEHPCSPMLDHFMNHSDTQPVRDPQPLKTSDPPTTTGCCTPAPRPPGMRIA